MAKGMQMTRQDVTAFRRKGNIQQLLADLIGATSREVEKRILSERNAALNAVFNHFDADHSGIIDAAEFQELCSYYSGKGKDFGPTAEEIKELMASLDKDGNGELQREEFIAFCMGGLARSVADRREYAKQSPMHRKLAVLLDRISLGIDRRTKALHTLFEDLVEGATTGDGRPTRALDAAGMAGAIQASGAAATEVKRNIQKRQEEDPDYTDELREEEGDSDEKKGKKKRRRDAREWAQANTAATRFIQALTGSRSGALEKNSFVLFLLSGGSDPLVVSVLLL